MNGIKTTGGCLCGAVRYQIAGPLPPPSACHCAQCRRQHGALGVYTLAPEDRYTIEGDGNLAWYDSSPTIRRGFCRVCGSKLFWQRRGSGQLDVTLGSIDEPTGLKIEKHIYLPDAGDYYDPPSR
jgi:hypothetical protein